MAHSIVALRVYRDGLHLIIRPHLSVVEIEAAIHQEMSRINRSITGRTVKIDMKCPTLTADELAYLTTKLQETYNLTVQRIEDEEEKSPPIAAAPTTHSISQRMTSQNHRDSEPSRVVHQTIRSGQREEFPQGSIIIFGDVNSGAEVQAGGDIIILGALRGNAHAGINGRLSAVIVAMELVPIQFQIGNFTGPRHISQKPRGYPEIARIGVEDEIIVEKFVKF